MGSIFSPFNLHHINLRLPRFGAEPEGVGIRIVSGKGQVSIGQDQAEETWETLALDGIGVELSGFGKGLAAVFAEGEVHVVGAGVWLVGEEAVLPALKGLDTVRRTAVVGVENEVERTVGGEGKDWGVIGIEGERDIPTRNDGGPGLAVVGGSGEGEVLFGGVARAVDEGELTVGGGGTDRPPGFGDRSRFAEGVAVVGGVRHPDGARPCPGVGVPHPDEGDVIPFAKEDVDVAGASRARG